MSLNLFRHPNHVADLQAPVRCLKTSLLLLYIAIDLKSLCPHMSRRGTHDSSEAHPLNNAKYVLIRSPVYC